MSPERPTLATYGPRGATVRVLIDAERGRVIVQWYERGKLKKKHFKHTAAGRAEAKAWAEGFAEERAGLEIGEAATIRDVWTAYSEASFPNLRQRTQELYQERWRKWEAFIGKGTGADAIELRDVDRFIARQRQLGASMNQTRHILNVVRIVFTWARTRKYIRQNELAGYRWKTNKKEKPLEIPEHTPAEFTAILAALSPDSPQQWRPWALLTIAGFQGPRINSARHLRWSDVGADLITWPAEWMKQGEVFEQPITDAVHRALEVCRRWRDRDGYTGPYLFYSARKSNKQPVYTYQSAWIAFRKAEDRAGVVHIPFRAFHGLRRMAAGNVYDVTKDAIAAAEWIGDKDLKQMRSYLKRRGERLQAGKAAMDGGKKG